MMLYCFCCASSLDLDGKKEMRPLNTAHTRRVSRPGDTTSHF